MKSNYKNALDLFVVALLVSAVLFLGTNLIILASKTECNNIGIAMCWSGVLELAILGIVSKIIYLVTVFRIFYKAKIKSKTLIVIVWVITILFINIWFTYLFEEWSFYSFGVINILIFPLFYLLYQKLFDFISSKN